MLLLYGDVPVMCSIHVCFTGAVFHHYGDPESIDQHSLQFSKPCEFLILAAP